MTSKRIGRIFTVVYSIVIGFILLRLALGPQTFTIYASLIWILLYPVRILRYFGNIMIFVSLYMIFWSYIVFKNIFVHKYSALSTCLWTVVWMVLVAAPFIPFGIQYFSLLRYSFQIYSNIARIIPFVSLLIVLILVNYFYFRQKLSTSIIWAMGISMVIILIITLADLLPALTSQPFFYALRYRVSFINTLIMKLPIIVQVLLIGIVCFALVLIDKNFIAETRKKSVTFRLLLPTVITIVMFFFLAFLQNDFNRYRNFDYSEGLSTIFLSNYENKEFFWFDARQIRVWPGSLKMLYPFGKYDLTDTLQQHAKELGSMTIIEGMNLYKLRRILKVLAYGPRDTIIYNALAHIIEQRVPHIPQYVKPLLIKAKTRFAEENKEIKVEGWVTLNREPWANITFCINRWFIEGELHFERIWQDTTNSNGHFRFTCFGGDIPATLYYQIYFIVPAVSGGNGFEHIKVFNIPHDFKTPGGYILDTIKIELQPSDLEQDFKEIIIEPGMPLDSFDMAFPGMGQNKRIVVDGNLSESGRLLIKNIDLEYLLESPKDRNFEQKFKTAIRTWYFFGKGDDQTIRVRINPKRRPLL